MRQIIFATLFMLVLVGWKSPLRRSPGLTTFLF
jgi:hypothetical protein